MLLEADKGVIVITRATENDLRSLLELYRYLNPDDPVLPQDDQLQQHWRDILDNAALHYVIARAGDRLVSTCALSIIPNLTRSVRPYGLIENVVTHPDYRKRGIGTQVLQYALEIAWRHHCYKVMLLTGSKNEATLRFYERAGFVRGEKTGFVVRADPERAK